jgi:excisionase family DNA binding protein
MRRAYTGVGRVTDLRALFAPDLVAAIEQLVDQRVAEALANERKDGGPSKRWLSVGETAAYLGCSTKAVYARIDRERIPTNAVKRSGRSVLIDRHALDRALDR